MTLIGFYNVMPTALISDIGFYATIMPTLWVLKLSQLEIIIELLGYHKALETVCFQGFVGFILRGLRFF